MSYPVGAMILRRRMEVKLVMVDLKSFAAIIRSLQLRRHLHLLHLELHQLLLAQQRFVVLARLLLLS